MHSHPEDRNGKDLRRFVSAMDVEIRHAHISRFNKERENWFNLLIIKDGEQQAYSAINKLPKLQRNA